MFERHDTFLMTVDVEVDYEPIDRLGLQHPRPLADTRALAIQPLIQSVHRTAAGALSRHGQKPKRNGADLHGDWPRISVRFQGDAAGAAAAYRCWCESVSGQEPIRRILSASLRGSDGTNHEFMDDGLQKEYEAMWNELSEDEKVTLRLLTA